MTKQLLDLYLNTDLYNNNFATDMQDFYDLFNS